MDCSFIFGQVLQGGGGGSTFWTGPSGTGEGGGAAGSNYDIGFLVSFP